MPRPRETAPAPAGLGAVLGAVLGGPFGAAIGGLIGGAVGTAALPLEESLRRKLAEVGLKFEGLRRTSKFQIHVLSRDRDGRFWPIVASVVLRPIDVTEGSGLDHLGAQPLEGDVLDDALYDAAVASLNQFLANRGTT